MNRLLYILPGLVPPGPDRTRDKFTYLSEIAEGEVLLPIWSDSENNLPSFLREGFPVYRRLNFNYNFFLFYRPVKPLRKLCAFVFYVSRGLKLHRKRKFDVIVTYGTNLTGIAGIILKWLTGAKLITEIPGVPENAFRFDTPETSKLHIIKRFFANRLLNLVGTVSDCLRLFYPQQLEKFPRLQKKKLAVFHEFVPVRVISSENTEEQFVLSVGHPWYTKGMDVLIMAFRSIAQKFPGCKLRLMGYYPDREHLDRLIGRCDQIEFLAPREAELAIRVISSATVYVLASRTESMGRVLLEAMAARKPIIASAVGGVPHYVVHNDNGLLFESENAEDLATKLSTLLSDPELSTRLGNRAFEKVMSDFDEASYVRSFRAMLESLSQSAAADSVASERDQPQAANGGKME